eukprot:365425-Chlamydomonas_euryale.AAC.19
MSPEPAQWSSALAAPSAALNTLATLAAGASGVASRLCTRLCQVSADGSGAAPGTAVPRPPSRSAEPQPPTPPHGAVTIASSL